MTNINATALASLICGGGGAALTAAVAAIAIAAAALVGAAPHSQAYADSPTSSNARASQPPADASQALRRYTQQLLRILSNPDANRWERYRQAMPHCADAPARLAEINAAGDVSALDATLAALTEDLCSDLDQRLDEARTVGLLINEPEAMRGYTLIPGRSNNYVRLIDHLGRVAHSWQLENGITHARLLDNGHLLVPLDNDNGRSIAEVDQDSNIVYQYSPPGYFHHDFLKMPNGNLLLLLRGSKTREEAVAAGANPAGVPSGGMRYDYLIEVRPTGTDGGEIVWEWSSWDYRVQDFDAGKDNYGVIAEHPELIDLNFLVESPPINPRTNAWIWLHINGIDYNPDLDQIALSLRNHSELWIIDHNADAQEAQAKAAPLYRWGNPRAYGHGTIADRRLFLQHHTQWIAPGLPGAGNILVFNNGWAHEEDQIRNYSSIEEIVPPTDGYGYRREPGAPYLETDPVWTYTAEPPSDFYSRVMGCVQRLPNGNTLICDSTSGTALQVTPDGKTVWKYVYPVVAGMPLKQGEEVDACPNACNNAVYRAYWYAPDHPGLQKYDLTPGDTIELYE